MCKTPEPTPQSFFAPKGMFTDHDLQALGATYLGDRIRWGGSYFTIDSAPFCRLYWNLEGKAEADTIESSWIKDKGGKWIKKGNNYLSYQLTNGDFCTPKFGLI